MPILPDNSVEYTEEAEAITSENMTDGSSVTENNATYNDPFDYNGPADIGVPDPLPVVPVVPEEEDEYYYVTYYNRGDLTEYEPAYLQDLAEAGCKFYAIYDDETEVEIQWTDIEDLDPLETEIDISASISSATNQHFWDDTNGVHVAEVAKEDWQSALEAEFSDLSSSKNYYNILMNSLGLLLRRANFILTSINRASISFYDGLGNETTNIMASFGRNSAQIGRSNDKHVVINNSGLTAYNSDGTLAPLTGTFDGANINNSSITNAKIVDGTIEGAKIASATIDNSNIKNGTITGAKIADGTIENTDIKNGTITGTKIASATIDNSNIKNGTIEGTKIASATIDNSNIKNGTITGAKIADGTITGAKIASATIENSNIKDGTIQGSKIIGSTLTGIPYAGISDADIEVARVANAEIAKAEVNYAHITNGVIDNAKIDHADVNGLSANYATVANLNAATARIGSLEAADVTINGRIDATEADIDDLEAEDARIGNLVAQKASITNLNAATARISDLEADHVSVEDFEAEQANIDNLQAATADIATIRANSAKVQNLTAAQLEADHATVGSLSTTYATITNLNAANGRISDLESTRVRTTDLEANYITADTIEANYTKTDLSNTDVAWIQNGTIKDGAISNAMIGSLSASKLTAGTINGNTITVTNLNADNITAGTLNGQRIGEGSLSLSKLEEDVYTESEVDSIVSNLQTQIDGAIETWTGTAVPTLNNSPASGWTTNAVKDSHVGDVYFVVNSNSQQNGYNYRFTKSGSTYSWQLIKDSDVTNALQRLTTAEGKIGTIEQFDSDISSWKTDTDEELASIKSAATTLAGRVTTAEGQIATKVETSTFNTLSQTVDENSASISQLTTETTTLTSKVETQNPFIIGTQTAQTGSWTGNASTLTSLVDGQQITYWLPFAGSGNASLNLTLKDGTTTGAIPCYYGGTTRLTTHYAANNAIHLTYRTNISGIAQGWWADANYDSNSPYSKYSDTVVSGKNGLKRYTLCMRDDVGNFTSIVNQANNINASGKTCYTGGLQLGSVCYHATGGDYAAGANSGVIWESYGCIDFRYSTNGITNAAATTELQLRKPVYLVGTIGADGLFYLDTTKWWTQTSFVENKAYVFVGTAYSSYYGIFIAVDNPTYIYEDGELVEITTLQISKTTNKINTVSDTVDEHTRKIGLLETSVESKADGSTVETMSTKLNTVSDTVDGHTQSISSITSTQTTMQGKLDKTLVETTQLWFSKANTTAPNKPTAQVTSTSTAGNAWRVVVPAYDASYPNYYYCYQWKYSDGTYGWSSVTRDIAMGESQERARTAITNAAAADTKAGNAASAAATAQSTADTANTNASAAVSTANTANTNASTALSTANTAASDASDAKTDAAAAVSTANTASSNASTALSTANTANSNASTAVSTANTAKSTADTAKATADKNVKSTTQLWYTKANETAPAKPTTKVTSTAVSGNGWRVVVPTYASDYPYYFYCYQYELADGTCTWSDVVYDRATTENQSNSRSAVTGVSTLTTKTNDIQDTVDGHTQSLQSVTQTQTTIQQNAVKSTVQLWFTKANITAPNKPTAHVTTNNAATGNAWNLAVPTYNTSYPNYYYCYEYQYLDGSYGWSAVTRDIATGEMQERARTAITNAAAADTKAGNAATAAANAQADIDGLEIGGRNYILDSSGVLISGLGSAAGSRAEYRSLNVGQSYVDIEHGTQVTISFDLYMTVNTANPTLLVYNTNVKGPKAFSNSASGTGSVSGVSLRFTADVNDVIDKRVSVTGYINDRTSPSVTDNYLEFYSNYGTSNWFSISNLKLEKGNRETDWTPAPEDVDADISTAQTSANNAQATADKNVKESIQLWFTKANGSAPDKPTSAVTSTSTSGNAWTTKVPTYSASYPHYFYCMQYKLADDTYTWSDVVYDQATTEAQSVARTTSTNLSTLQQDYATFKQTTQNFESTIGTTYATKTEVSAVDDKIDNLEIGGRNLLMWTAEPKNGGTNDGVSGPKSTGWHPWNSNFEITDTTDGIKGTFVSGTTGFVIPFVYDDAVDNEECVLSFDYRTNCTSFGQLHYLCRTSPNISIYPGFTPVANETDWQHAEIKFKMGSHANRIAYALLYPYVSADGKWVEIKNHSMKLEKGNRATDWTPAPEEIDASIAAVPRMMKVNTPAKNFTVSQWKLYGARNHYEYWGTGSAYDNSKLRVGDRAYVIGTVSDQNGGTATIIGEVTEINPVGSGTTNVRLKAEQLIFGGDIVSAIESRVSSAETSITQTNQQIALKANASDVYTKTQTDGLISTEVSNRNSAIEQSASAINLSVSQNYTTKTEFNALEIGGRNYLKGSELMSRDDYGWFADSTNASISDGVATLNGTASYWNAKLSSSLVDVNLFDDDYVRVSFDYKANIDSLIYIDIDGCNVAPDQKNNNSRTKYKTSSQTFPAASEWTRYEWPVIPSVMSDITVGSGDVLSIYVGIWNRTDNSVFQIRHLKLEKGTKATDWSPAPEDMATQSSLESAKSEIKATTDGITSTVEKISSAKYLNSGSLTLSQLKTWAAESYSRTWSTTSSTENLRVGDTVYLKVSDTTRSCNSYVKGTVTAFTSNSITLTAHGYEDILPVDTIKSTINQSSDSVKIQAKHVEIDGAAIFSNSAFKTAADAAYDAKGSAATAKSEAISAAASDATSKANAVNSSLESYKTTVNSTLSSLQNQVDGQIEAWYKSVDPTASNEPASAWTTSELKQRHEGDLYYNINNGHSWRWLNNGGTYSWQQIPDSDAAAALAAAQNAQTSANTKRRIFTTTPTVPYDVGDLWVNGAQIKYANASRSSTQSYTASDWVLTATDDSNIPTNVSELTNDANYGTTSQIATAKSEAISTAASDATSKANAAETSAKGYADTKKSEAISAAATDATSKANAAETNAKSYSDTQTTDIYKRIRSQGIQLVTNGNGFMGDNTNWPDLTFDGSKANASPGSFTRSVENTTVISNEMFPVDASKEYLFEFDAMSADGTGRLYSMFVEFDVDKARIDAANVNYISNTLTTLAQDLNPGDTTVKLTSAANWQDTVADHKRSLIFWDYSNSYGYIYPSETYSRHCYRNVYADNSKVNKSTGVITLRYAWTGPKYVAGTYVSQNQAGNSYNYAHVYIQIPSNWTHYSFIYSGLANGGDTYGKFRQGIAFAKVGFLWNYAHSSTNPQGQIWITNISVKEAVATKAELNSVATTANNAAPKSSAIARTQRIYWRATSNTKPSANTTWLTTSGDGYGNWSLNVPQLTKGATKYPYLFTAVQTQTVAQQAVGTTCTCSAVMIDDSTTVIDGGKIITGSIDANAINASSGTFDTANIPNLNASKITSGTIDAARIAAGSIVVGKIDATSGTFNTANIPALTADHIKANVINAVNNGTGTINADKINASNLTIGYSQLTNTPTIPSKVSDLTNDSGFQTSSQVDTAITSKGYATTTQAQGYANTAKSEAISAAATDATNKANAVQTNLDNLEIGGRNLLRYDVKNMAFGNGVVLINPNYRGMYCAVTEGTYTVSRKVIEGNRFAIYWCIEEPASNVTLQQLFYDATALQATVDIPETANWLFIYLSNQGDTINNGNIKVERGTKATDWTPAPEDVDSAITSINDAVNSGRNWYAESSTAAGTVDKVATISPVTTEFTTDILNPGTTVYVKFSATNSGAVASLTLNVNGTGAKNIKYRVNNGTQANLPAANYIVANQLHKFTYDGTYWVMDINYYTDSNAVYTKYYNAIVAGENLTAASIIGGRVDGKFYQIKENSSFDLSHPLLWTTVAISSGGTNYANIYTQCYDRTLSTYYTSFANTTANRMVYLVGTISGNTFTTYGANSNSYLTVTPPTTADGRFYIPLGRLGNQSNGKTYFNFQVNTPVTLFAYLDGKFRQVTPTEVVGEQYIYCSAISGTNSMSKYETWVEPPTSVTASTQNSWTTKRPEYSSSYPVLFVAKQTKRLDGTVTCTTPVKDDTTTIIDGGHITTGTIDADRISTTVINAINANVSDTINADKINAGSLTIGYSQINNPPSIPTKVSQLTNDSNFVNTTQLATKSDKTLPDTRNDNQPPSWYISTYPRQSITEFKYANKIGFTSAASNVYCTLTTIVPWNDASGGYPTQSTIVSGVKYYRVGTGASTWSDWSAEETAAGAQAKADSKDDAIAAAAKRTNVAVAVTAIDYDLGTATLQATLYIDGTATTSNVTYKWLKDGSVISGQTARTLSVTAAMGLSHVYSCTVTYS